MKFQKKGHSLNLFSRRRKFAKFGQPWYFADSLSVMSVVAFFASEQVCRKALQGVRRVCRQVVMSVSLTADSGLIAVPGEPYGKAA